VTSESNAGEEDKAAALKGEHTVEEEYIVPVAQATQAVEPREEATSGLVHDRQEEEPGKFEKVPRAHGVQMLEELKEKEPAGHGMHI